MPKVSLKVNSKVIANVEIVPISVLNARTGEVGGGFQKTKEVQGV